MDGLLSGSFYRRCAEVNREVQSWRFERVLFPHTQYITEGDEFFRSVWRAIDESRTYAWITTYAMDRSIPANTTLSKLTAARKRGVNTVLLVDDLQQRLDPELLTEYKAAGGTFCSLNPFLRFSSLKKIANKELFRRHHEKMVVADDKTIIGSSNLESGYACTSVIYVATKFGSRVFRDFNCFSENICLEEFRANFARIASLYNIQLDVHHSNDETLRLLKQKFPNSVFYDHSKFRFLRSHQPSTLEIQEEVLKNIRESQHKILIVQPYYYPIKAFEEELMKGTDSHNSAIDRGVFIELITSAKRDQPVYKYIKNGLLMRRLIRKGVHVYESHQKILHAKAYVFDDRIMTVGSFNNDRWSWRISNETNVSIHSEAECEKARPYFEELKARCHLVNDDTQIGVFRRLRLMFWERFLYLSEVMMSKTAAFNFGSFWKQSPLSQPSETTIEDD